MSGITGTQKALIVIYNGLNYDYDEIASEVDVGESTVSKYVNEWEDEAKASDAPVSDVYAPLVLGAVFDGGFLQDTGGMLFGHLDK